MPSDSPRPPLTYRVLDAAMTASIRPRRRLGSHLRSVVSPRSSHSDRVAAVVNALDAVIPGTARRATKLICRPLGLPFASDEIELMASGSGATVFLARGQRGADPRVVKVYRRSLGATAERLRTLLAEYREHYRQLSALYRDVPGLMPATEYLVGRGPILGHDAIIAVQELVPSPMRDFRTFSDEAFQEAVAAAPALGQDMQAFGAATLDLYRTRARAPDVLGADNLNVSGTGPTARLRLIDFRLYDVDRDGARRPALRGQLERCLERIEALARLAARMQRPLRSEGDR